MGLVTLKPSIPEGVGGLFYVHLFFVCVLLAYFPFSKLMHLGGIFMSPTRNLANNSRIKRHINPWNHAVKVHTYEHYEDEFRVYNNGDEDVIYIVNILAPYNDVLDWVNVNTSIFVLEPKTSKQIAFTIDADEGYTGDYGVVFRPDAVPEYSEEEASK